MEEKGKLKKIYKAVYAIGCGFEAKNNCIIPLIFEIVTFYRGVLGNLIELY